MEAERKTIRRHLLNLIDCGYEIEYSESVRMVPNPKTGVPEESYLWSSGPTSIWYATSPTPSCVC